MEGLLTYEEFKSMDDDERQYLMYLFETYNTLLSMLTASNLQIDNQDKALDALKQIDKEINELTLKNKHTILK